MAQFDSKGTLARLSLLVPLAILGAASGRTERGVGQELRRVERQTGEVRHLAASSRDRLTESDRVSQSRTDIQRALKTIEHITGDQRNNKPKSNSAINPLLGTGEMCPQPGQVYFETGSNLENQSSGSVVIHVAGPAGIQSYTFASGISQISIITALNSFTDSTGVQATQSELNPDRVVIRTVEANAPQFVRVIQMNGVQPYIYSGALSSRGAFQGEDIGRGNLTWDLDCNGIIWTGDLVLLLGAWGSCPPEVYCSPDFNGNGVVNIEDLIALLNAWDTVH